MIFPERLKHLVQRNIYSWYDMFIQTENNYEMESSFNICFEIRM